MAIDSATKNYHMLDASLRCLGFDGLRKQDVMFNWTKKELSSWSTRELQELQHNIFEELSSTVGKNKTMMQNVLSRISIIVTDRMWSKYERAKQAWEEQQNRRRVECVITSTARIFRRV